MRTKSYENQDQAHKILEYLVGSLSPFKALCMEVSRGVAS